MPALFIAQALGYQMTLTDQVVIMLTTLIASVGAGWATVPGAHQETVTSRAGSFPQVSSSCSGAVVVGSGSVVVGGPLGAVAASARGARTAVPATKEAAPTPTVPMMNRRLVKPGLPGDEA